MINNNMKADFNSPVNITEESDLNTMLRELIIDCQGTLIS